MRELRNESAVLASSAQFADAAVIELPSALLERVAVVSAPAFVSGPEVRAILTEANAAPPRVVVFCNEITRLQSGQVDLEWFSTLDLDAPDVYHYIPPASEIEKRLAELWQDELGIRDIGALDDFVDLGGDSMTAVTITERIMTEFGVSLPLIDFFDAATVRGLAPLVRPDFCDR